MSHLLLHATLSTVSLFYLSCVVVVFFSEPQTRFIAKNLVSKSCPTANHSYAQLAIRQKALRRRLTRTSKTSNYVRCWHHHCKYGNERKMKDKHELNHSERESLMVQSSRNPEVSGKPDAECVQKREANAQQTQAYHSRRESLMTNSFRET